MHSKTVIGKQKSQPRCRLVPLPAAKLPRSRLTEDGTGHNLGQGGIFTRRLRHHQLTHYTRHLSGLSNDVIGDIDIANHAPNYEKLLSKFTTMSSYERLLQKRYIHSNQNLCQFHNSRWGNFLLLAKLLLIHSLWTYNAHWRNKKAWWLKGIGSKIHLRPYIKLIWFISKCHIKVLVLFSCWSLIIYKSFS